MKKKAEILGRLVNFIGEGKSWKLLDCMILVLMGTHSHGITGEKEITICRLDKVFTTSAEISRFQPIKASHLPHYGLDHVVVRIELERQVETGDMVK